MPITKPDPVTYEELFVFVQGIAKTDYATARMDAANLVDVARALTRRGMSSKPDPADMKALRRAVAAASDGRPSLSDFLDRIRELHPALEALVESGTALIGSGGEEGRVTEPIADWGVMLCYGWFKPETSRTRVVEWSYIS